MSTRVPVPKPQTRSPIQLTVLHAERPWESPNPVTRSDDGLEFLTLDVRLVNAGNRPQHYSYVEFSVETADGRVWQAQPAWRRPGLGTGYLQRLESLRGWLTFAVPVGDPVTVVRWFPRGEPTRPFPLTPER